jgi:glycosyltransferase involved in cell wall biosynthesis
MMASLRTLVIAQNLPYPTFNGADLRNWHNVDALLGVGQVGVFGFCSNDPRRGESPRAELAFWRWSSDPALSFPLPKDRKLASRAWFLDPAGHPSDLFYSETAAAELTAIMDDFKPQLVVLEGVWLHRYIDILRRTECRLVLDSHNLETVVAELHAELTLGNDLQAKLIREVLPGRAKMIERKVAHAVDQIWMCSRTDAQLMQELHAPPAAIHVVPNAVDVASYAEVRSHRGAPAQPTRTLSSPGSFATENDVAQAGSLRHTLLFPGLFIYPPNALAATFLIEEVCPRVSATDHDCRLTLVGGWPTPQMKAAAERDPRIVVTGIVPDVRPFLAEASVMAVPLFHGSGTRFKILEALAATVPVVTTAKGAEGLDVEAGVHLLMAETADEFAEAIKRICNDQECVARLTANGLTLVEREYSWNVVGRRIRQAVTELDLAVFM